MSLEPGMVAPNATPTPPFVPAGGGNFSTLPKQVSLKPGQIVHFKPGKGYYAGGAVAQAPAAKPTPTKTTTTAPPSSGGSPSAFAPYPDVQGDAKATATGEVNSMIAPVVQQGAAADAVAKAQQLEAAGFNSAANKLLASIGPQIQAGYAQAGQEEGQLAKGFTSSVQSQLTKEQQAGADMAAQLGATGQNLPNTVDPSAFGNALYDRNGFIPGTLLQQQGAHALQQSKGNQVVNVDVGRAEQQNLQAQQSTDDAKTAQQVATIAAKYPQLFTAQEHADITANLKGASLGETATRDYNNAVHQNNQDTLALTKEGFSEHLAQKKLTVSIDSLNAKISYQNGELKIRGESADASWLRAQTAAHAIDASASKVAGHIVLKNGQPLLTKAGKYVGVDPKAYSTSSQKNTPAGRYQSALKQASTDFNTQDKAERVPTGTLAGGTYVLAPGTAFSPATDFPGGKVGSVIYPASTNDASRAATSSTVPFATKVDQYMQEFTITRAQARKALIAGGWKPDGVKPKTTIPSTFPAPGFNAFTVK